MCAVNPAVSCFINPVNGSDSNPGTQLQPKRSFNGAFAIQCVNINAAAGTYSGDLNRNQEPGYAFSVISPGVALIDVQQSGRFLRTNHSVNMTNVEVRRGTIDCDGSDGGAAIFSDGGCLTLNNCAFIDNQVRSDGENGIEIHGGAIRARCIRSNSSVYAENRGRTTGGSSAVSIQGGAVFIDGDGGVLSSFSNDVFEFNFANSTGLMARAMGGALYVTDADINLFGVRFSGNRALSMGSSSASRGGALRYFEEVDSSIRNCTFEENSAAGDDARGGALHITDAGTMVFSEFCKFSLNSADKGGAVVVDGNTVGSVLHANGNVFCNNTAPSEADGYAVFTNGAGNVYNSFAGASRFQCQPNSPPDDAWNDAVACINCVVVAPQQCALCA